MSKEHKKLIDLKQRKERGTISPMVVRNKTKQIPNLNNWKCIGLIYLNAQIRF